LLDVHYYVNLRASHRDESPPDDFRFCDVSNMLGFILEFFALGSYISFNTDLFSAIVENVPEFIEFILNGAIEIHQMYYFAQKHYEELRNEPGAEDEAIDAFNDFHLWALPHQAASVMMMFVGQIWLHLILFAVEHRDYCRRADACLEYQCTEWAEITATGNALHCVLLCFKGRTVSKLHEHLSLRVIVTSWVRKS
jgi:hypothetical protein